MDDAMQDYDWGNEDDHLYDINDEAESLIISKACG